MKKILLVAIFMLAIGGLKAQDYNWAIGVRGGVTTGPTFKYNLDPTNSIEAIIGLNHGFNLFGLYERHMPVITEGFRFYYGGGVNMGAWGWRKHRPFTMGINGIVGLEYKVKDIPLAFSVDYKPNWNFTGYDGFIADDFGLSIKVAF